MLGLRLHKLAQQQGLLLSKRITNQIQMATEWGMVNNYMFRVGL
jgi:hypothetical protein